MAIHRDYVVYIDGQGQVIAAHKNSTNSRAMNCGPVIWKNLTAGAANRGRLEPQSRILKELNKIWLGQEHRIMMLKTENARLRDELNKANPTTRTFTIWIEGYSVTGNRGSAQLAGEQEAKSFEEACELFFASHTGYGKFNSKYMTVWGCGVFDNETDAKRSFG